MGTVTTVLLWLLGVVFLLAGAMKAFMPGDRLTSQPNMEWIDRIDNGLTQARIAGLSEVAAGLVFVLAALDVVGPVLAGVAALGIVVVMVLAAVRVHRPAGEPIIPNVALGVLALVLAIGVFTTG